MKIAVREFAGLRPKVNPDLLGPGEAVAASNVKLSSGSIEAIKGSQPIMTLPGPQAVSIYRFGQWTPSDSQYWFQSTVDADFVRGMVDGDTQERTYYTTATGAPRKTDATMATSVAPYPTAGYEMGVPAPNLAPLTLVTGSPTNADDAAEGLTYCVTYVTAWGEEGPPSASSILVARRPGQSVTVYNIPTGPIGNYNVVSKRIYRSATGSTSTRFQFLAEIPIGQGSMFDTTPTSQLGEVLTTKGWVEPPPSMRGLTAMANGILAGFTGNTICFSVPYTPYAWPVAYQLSVDSQIVGLAAFDQSLFVGTTNGVYIVTGSDPSAMAMEKLAVKQSCVSKRSIVPMMGGVVWAAPDGLCYVGSSGFKMLTEDLMTREQWQSYMPSSFTCFEHDGRYLAFYNNGSVWAGLIFDLGSKPTFTTTDAQIYGGYRDSLTDALYLVGPGNALWKWEGSPSPAAALWRSGTIRLPAPRPLSVARVDATAYPVQFNLHTDAGVFAQVVTSNRAFRLPPGHTERLSVEVVLAGNAGRVREIVVADSMQAMASGG